MDSDSLVFVHLSDIHFKNFVHSNFDLDRDLRNELERDMTDIKDRLDHIDAIMVSGDIAFSGKAEEYIEAVNWLKTLCSKINCPQENVWVVPGNHDIDRGIIESSKILRDIHCRLREVDKSEIDRNVKEYLYDEIGGKQIFEPLRNYNLFAVQFGCATSKDNIFWDEYFTLNDDSRLRVRGMNSVLISNALDNDEENKLILPSYQSLIPREDSVLTMTMCHHPPDWLRNKDEIEDHFLTRSTINLFGHKHVQRIVQINGCLRVSAGAVHPPRNEQNWEPRYNCLCIKVIDQEDDKKLQVRVWPRVWKSSNTRFEADFDSSGTEYSEYLFDPWSAFDAKIAAEDSENKEIVPTQNGGSTMKASDSSNENPLNDPKRKLAYLFFSLPFTKVIEISSQLKLIHDEDRNIDSTELHYQQLFRRAIENGQLAELWDKVKEYANQNLAEDNPFVNS